MGVVQNIGLNDFPRQMPYVGRPGVVRHDAEHPHRLITVIDGEYYVDGRRPSRSQGSWLWRRVEVCFHYDTANTIFGTIVREDVAEPCLEVIRLDDGRCILTTECMYTPR